MSNMQNRRIGKTDIAVGPMGLGGAPLGGVFDVLTEDAAAATLTAAFALGIRYFDTAPWYGHGLSEHRFGHYLRRQPRDSFVLSTKVGRVYRAPAPSSRVNTAPWVHGLPFELRFDYGYDGIMRSHEDSLQRLGINRVDMLLIHDLDFGYHGDEAGVSAHLRALDEGGFRALAELKAAGVIRAIGAGINEREMMARFLDHFDIDFFLVAMPYTLIDQAVLEYEFPRLLQRDVGVVVGSPFASGILATGAVPGARYAYAQASADIIERVSRIEAVCARHDVPLQAAALQFPLGHPCVAAVIPGAISAEQIDANVRWSRQPIPTDLWRELKASGLIHGAAPTPENR